MHIDTRTAVLVVRRLVKLRDNPPLFHERITPATIRRRLDRVLDWLGTGGRVIVGEYLRRGELPAPGALQWARRDSARRRWQA